MTRKNSGSDPRAAERATHLAVALYPADAQTCDGVLAESGLTRSGWVRGAIRAAAASPDVAAAIAEAADQTGHGGPRPGAGRPRRVSEADATVEEQEEES